MITGWTDIYDDRYEQLFWNNLYEKYPNCTSEIAVELKKMGYKFCGHYHQNGDYGAPIFDNKYVVWFSQRDWGAIMAKAYDIDNSDGYAYLKWAWTAPENEEYIVPSPEDYL